MAFVDQLNETAPAGQNYVATGSGFQLAPKGGTPPPSVPPIPPSAGSNANPTIPTGAPSTVPNKEPTALYSGNVQDKYQPELQAKLDAYKNTGHIVGEDNVVRDSSGNLVPAPQNTNPDQNGQYTVGGFIYGPPAKITGQNFDQEAFDRNINLFNQVKAQTDATTKAVLDNITDRYQTLTQQVQDNNMRSQKGLEQSLLMSGSLRYSAGSEGQIHELANQGILKIAQLENEKQSALLAAQQAADSNDWKTVDRIIAQSDKTKAESLAAARQVSDQLAKHYQDLIDAQTQSGKDTAVARQLSNGVIDPVEILKNLQAEGSTNISAKDVESTLANLSPDAREIHDALSVAAKYNAPADVLKAIGSARTIAEAYKAGAGFFQDSTSTAGQYAAYVKQAQAAGQTPISPSAFIAKQKYNEAYSTAAGTAAGKGGGGGGAGSPSSLSNPALQANGFTRYNTSTQTLAAQLVNGQLAPSQLSRRTTGSSSYNDVLTAADKYSMAVNGTHFDIAKADRQYKFAINPQTQNTLNFLGSLVGSDDGTGKFRGGNLNELIDLSDARIDAPYVTSAGVTIRGKQGFPALNNARQWAMIQTGNPATAAYYSTLLEVSDQVAKVLQGGGTGNGTSDAKLRQAQDLFQKGFTPDQVKAVAVSLQGLLGNRAASMIKGNPYLSDYAEQFGVQTNNGIVTTRQKIMQDETVAEGKITTFYNSSEEHKSLIEDIHSQFPDMSAQEVIERLEENGISL